MTNKTNVEGSSGGWSRRNLVILLGCGMSFFTVLCVVTIAFFVFDPFGWVERLFGGGDSVLNQG